MLVLLTVKRPLEETAPRTFKHTPSAVLLTSLITKRLSPHTGTPGKITDSSDVEGRVGGFRTNVFVTGWPSASVVVVVWCTMCPLPVFT